MQGMQPIIALTIFCFHGFEESMGENYLKLKFDDAMERREAGFESSGPMVLNCSRIVSGKGWGIDQPV